MQSSLLQIVKHEDGMMTFPNVVAAMLGFLILVLTLNVAHIVSQKVEMQNAADAVTYSGAVWQARGMNAITATNHVIGEMNAMCILHEAVGGALLENGGKAEAAQSLKANTIKTGSALQKINSLLETAYQAASSAGARTPAYNTVRESNGVHAEATVVDGKVTLKELLTKIYAAKVVAKAMEQSGIPPVVAAGEALELAMDALELKVLQEYTTLNGFEGAAQSLLPLKKMLRDQMMPAAKKYTTDVVKLTPGIAVEAATRIGELNQVTATLYPSSPELPVVIDPNAKAMELVKQASLPGPLCNCPVPERGAGRDQVVKITQLARASFPWVNYHRQPILDMLGKLVPLSKAKGFYFDHSNGYSKRLCDEYQTGKHDMGLYVMKDDGAPDKGYALWTEQPEKADRLFTIIGLAMREPPKVVGNPAVFTQEHGAGRMTYAQAILYNANEQIRHTTKIDMTCKRITPSKQANVGWDTLNWKSGSEQSELVGFGSGLEPKFPEIQINWQAKLIPATSTRLRDMYQERETLGVFAKVINKMLETTPDALRTH